MPRTVIALLVAAGVVLGCGQSEAERRAEADKEATKGEFVKSKPGTWPPPIPGASGEQAAATGRRE